MLVCFKASLMNSRVVPATAAIPRTCAVMPRDPETPASCFPFPITDSNTSLLPGTRFCEPSEAAVSAPKS